MLVKALKFAEKAHAGVLRKGTMIPYISHPMHVSAIVMEHGGSVDQACAALLHDVIEDSDAQEADLVREFNPTIATIVLQCSDSTTNPGTEKAPWYDRKVKYIKHLETHSHDQTLLVSLADKVHNASCIIEDVLNSKDADHEVWSRFSAPKKDVAWYYRSLLGVFQRRAGKMLNPGEGYLRLLRKFEVLVFKLDALATPYELKKYKVMMGDEMAFNPAEDESGWTEIASFMDKETALKFTKVFARYLVARADLLGHESHSNYENTSNSKLPRFTTSWQYIHSVALSGPDVDYHCASHIEECLKFPTSEDLDFIELHYDSLGEVGVVKNQLRKHLRTR